MNNHDRQERRIQRCRLEDVEECNRCLPDINRAHRACERECLDLKAHIKALESLLARAGEHAVILYSGEPVWIDTHNQLIAEIDAILPATEGKKDE